METGYAASFKVTSIQPLAVGLDGVVFGNYFKTAVRMKLDEKN